MKNIDNLYSRLIAENKNILISTLAKEYGISETSVRTNWFSSGKVPEHCKARVHELMINMLKSQGEATEKMIKND